jgi:hypothetical protein
MKGEKLWDQMHRIMTHGPRDAMLPISAIDCVKNGFHANKSPDGRW